MADKPDYYLAHTPTYPGYWGKHTDGPHHAIANACAEGADRYGLFIVYRGKKSLTMNGMGNGIEWDMDDGEPQKEGVYSAAGHHFADTLEELAERTRDGYFIPEEFGLGRQWERMLKQHGK